MVQQSESVVHVERVELEPMQVGVIEKIKKRTGHIVAFQPEKIASAIEKAMAAVRGTSQPEAVARLMDNVMKTVVGLYGNRIPDVEGVQDQVERALMENGFYDVARAYILYRERQHTRRREKQNEILQKIEKQDLNVTKRDGTQEPFDLEKLERFFRQAVDGYQGVVDVKRLVRTCQEGVYEGITTQELGQLAVMTTRSFIEENPCFDKITTRLFLTHLYREVLNQRYAPKNLEQSYREAFKHNIRQGVESGRFTAKMLEFDMDRLASHLTPSRDELFSYRGVQVLYDRYLQVDKAEDRRIETPQAFWMRVSMGLSLTEAEPNKWAIKFYDLLSSLRFVSSTPTLFHSGTTHPQLSSCYITKVDDSLEHIFKSISDNAMLSKWSGGLGNDWTHIRGMGAAIKSTGVESQGVIPFLKIANDTTAAINRSGKRRGATCAYLENWHIDVEDFLDLRRNTGDERRRTHDMNTAMWIPDLFMKRMQSGGHWTLFSPDEVPDLHDTYGKDFEARYLAYEAKAERGQIALTKRVKALDLWKKMITRLFETGHPWITFKDPCNVRSPQDHVGTVHSSNLCTEITLNTCAEEVAVCFPAGTKILTRHGQKPIEECDGEEVFVPFHNQGDLPTARQDKFVRAKLIRNGTKEVFRITTQSGAQIDATEDHPFMVQNKVNNQNRQRSYTWVPLRELTEGDLLTTPFTPALPDYCDPLPQDADFAAAGWMLGDGWQTETSYGAVFGPQETYAKEQVTERLIDWHQSSELSQNAAFAEPPSLYTQPNGVMMWATQRQGFIDTVKARFGFKEARAPQKIIGTQIFNASPAQQASFLAGLFSADGCVQLDKRKHTYRGTVELCSASEKLLQDVQLLLRAFGVHGRIRGYTPKDRDGRWQGILSVNNVAQIKRFAKLIGFSLSPRKQQKLVQTIEKLEQRTSNTRPGWEHSKIVSIEKIGKEEVFDLALPTDHNFIANGLVVHNCNLGSVNLSRHIHKGKLDPTMIEETVDIAMRMLDNVVDINFYPIPEAQAANLKHRPVGMGIMGFQDALYMLNLPFDCDAAMDFADESMELVSYHALLASSKLAHERGAYQSYKGSKWDRGILPCDTVDLLERERGMPIEVKRGGKLDWTPVRESIKKHGMRNSNCLAIAPTATISNISGCFPSIEPIYKNLYVKSNMSGEFTVINTYLIEDLKARGLWNQAVLEELKYRDGNIQALATIPQDLKDKYKTAFEIDAEWLIRAASRRGKWIDQSQSLNIFLQTSSGRRISDVYTYAWQCGLKTTYYLRTLGASGVEKSTVDVNRFSNGTNGTNGTVNGYATGAVCNMDDPTCEACQ